MPELAGIGHVALAVTNLERSRLFWSDVLGLRPVIGDDTYCAMVTPSTPPSLVVLSTTEQPATAPFTGHSAGLDHVCLSVPSVSAMTAWRAHLDAHGVPFGSRNSEWGQHIDLRDPDDIAVELFLLDPGSEVVAALSLMHQTAFTHIR